MTRRRLAVLPILLALGVAIPAWAAHPDEQIVLPGATSAEGIATGEATTFYAGDIFTGNIFRGSLQARHGRAVHRRSPDGRMAAGLKYGTGGTGLLFVAGLDDRAKGYVYDTTQPGRTVADLPVRTAQPAPRS